MPVRYPAATESVLFSGRIPRSRDFSLPPFANVESVRLALGRSALVLMEGQLRQLLEYPYGCVEQTTSKTIPLLACRDLGIEKTDEMIGAGIRRLLSMLRPHAIVVNTARGALVDETALVELLEAGSIGGAGLDVLGSEPPPADHPLLSAPRVVLTPHVGFRTAEASGELIRVSLENLIAYARGEPQNVRG